MTGLARFEGPEFARLISRARRSLERTGGDPTGRFSIGDPTDAERKAVAGLLGRHLPPGTKRVTIELAGLDAALRAKTGSGLVDVLERLGPRLRDRPGDAERERRARAALLTVARASPLYDTTGWFSEWVGTLRRDGGFTRLIKDPLRFTEAVRVLEHIDGSMMSLPRLAGRATGDAHALDHPRPLAGLVLGALAVRAGLPRPREAEERRRLWDRFNVILDDLASRVLVLNLGAGGPGLGEWLSGAAAFGTPFHVTLHQLVTHPLRLDHPVVHVCENPAVLREAAEELGRRSPPLLCTEGWPSSAFHLLAGKIVEGGGELRYHGDFDWDGAGIAAAVISRHGAVPWRLGVGDYLEAIGREGAGVALKGAGRPTPWDPELGPAMARVGRAIFEETVVDLLLSDLSPGGA